MDIVFQVIATTIGVFGVLVFLGHIRQKKDRLKLQKEMASWLAGDTILLNPKSQIREHILDNNPYHKSNPGLILVRWNTEHVEVQTISGTNYFVDINNVSENVSAINRKISAELDAFQKTEEERKTLNPDTLYNDISIYAMKREQLKEALAGSQEVENYELCEKIKNIIKDKYEES